jgi:small subunit ribosomal protein S20
MPHTRNAKKRLRQYSKRRLYNRTIKKAIRLQIRKLLEVLEKGPTDSLAQELRITVKKLDKAAARRVVHPNMAARKKSQLARKVHAKLFPAKV